MSQRKPVSDRPAPSSAAASVFGHILLVGVVFLVPAPPKIPPPAEQVVAIAIVTPRRVQSRPTTPAPPVLAAPVRPQTIEPREPGMIRPTEMLSAKALADPRSRKALAALATFTDSERMVQVCNLEAMAQIEAWRHDLHPQNVVSYAQLNEKIVGQRIVADGAAVRSGTNWYGLKYRCDLTPDHAKVAAFEFQLGDAIPRDLWDEYGLTTGDDADDDE